MVNFMKGKTGVILGFVFCLALGIALLVRHHLAVEQHVADEAKIVQLSNDVVQTQAKLSDQQKVNLVLETNLAVRTIESENLSNKLSTVSATLARTEEDAKTAAQNAKEQIARRDAKISELEGQNDDLTKKMGDLNTSISGLEVAIADTEKKLAASEGDRDVLLKELKRLQAEKAELEKKFNDLAVVREQVRKLKDELSISRRIQWIRDGLYDPKKGAERLQKGFAAAPGQTNFDLNVEIRQDGSAKVIPPATNSPAPSPSPK